MRCLAGLDRGLLWLLELLLLLLLLLVKIKLSWRSRGDCGWCVFADSEVAILILPRRDWGRASEWEKGEVLCQKREWVVLWRGGVRMRCKVGVVGCRPERVIGRVGGAAAAMAKNGLRRDHVGCGGGRGGSTASVSLAVRAVPAVFSVSR